MVVEDEILIAMMVEAALNDVGCDVVGPFARLGDAMMAARSEPVDAALLDINLDGDMVFPAADILVERGVPFLLATGYGRGILPDYAKHWPVLDKPYRIADVLGQLTRLVAGAAAVTPDATPSSAP